MEATFNQLHQWRQTSQYWDMLINLPEDKQRREIQFKDRHSGTPYKNILFYYIEREFKELFGGDFAVREHFDLFTRESVDCCYEYPSVYIHTSFCSCLGYSIDFTIYGIGSSERRSIKTTGNAKITREYIINTVFTWIDKNILYAPGYFRDLQLMNNWSKDQVKDNYRYYISHKQDVDIYDVDIKRYFARKYRIIPSDYLNIVDWNGFAIFCSEYIKVHGKPGKVKTVTKFNIWDVLNDFDGDIDEAESLFWDHVDSYPKDTILI